MCWTDSTYGARSSKDEDGARYNNIAAQTHHFVGENGLCMLNVPDLESTDNPQIKLFVEEVVGEVVENASELMVLSMKLRRSAAK